MQQCSDVSVKNHLGGLLEGQTSARLGEGLQVALSEVVPRPHTDTDEASEMKDEFAFICLCLSPSFRL